ncbi:phage tail protein [Aeromonas caviae]|uniref:phage tail protein n=1 Tax=Aeromonas caviae TaxID=648 RepID=UPI001CC774E4|nr:phage tail protein [Aeromonas caviae]BDA11935.1 phage tail protein [Aeromonas caviae]
MSAIYFAIPTDAGQAKIANAIALGIPLKITHMAVGDGNGQPVTPNAAQKALVRETRRAPINTLFQDPTNQSQLVAEQIIPENVGDWWIREAGIFSEDGTLIAIANTPDTYKPLLSSGAGRTQVIRIVLIVSDTSAVELKIDPAVVLATRKYVDDLMAAELAKLDNKQSVRVATTGAIALTATKTIDGVVLAVGDRVLVKDQADTKQNGIYLVAAQAWTRTTDADTGAKLSSGARVYVEEGAVNGAKAWYLATSGGITVGTTALSFKDEHPDATEAVKGKAQIATQAEVYAGTDDSKFVTAKKLMAALTKDIAANGYPAGAPIPWPLETPPDGYLMMTGQSFSAATYPKLALAYPALVLPDMRAEFIRGWDAGRGVDLNRSMLTNQSDLTKAHSHHISANAPTSHDEGWKLGAIRSDTYPAGRGIPATADTGAGSFLPSPSGHSLGAIGIVGGVETRPRNIAFNYIVRAA